jgi:hypothetical protein
MNDHYLISLEVKYEPDATRVQRSLGRVAPELVHADLALTEDEDVREWTGGIDRDTYARLADGWGLDGHLARYRHVFDGMEFEEGGFSPIVWVTLSVRQIPKASSASRIVGNRREIVRPRLMST